MSFLATPSGSAWAVALAGGARPRPAPKFDEADDVRPTPRPERTDPPEATSTGTAGRPVIAETLVQTGWGAGGTINLVVTDLDEVRVSGWELTFALAPGAQESWVHDLEAAAGARITASEASRGDAAAVGEGLVASGPAAAGGLAGGGFDDAGDVDTLILL